MTLKVLGGGWHDLICVQENLSGNSSNKDSKWEEKQDRKTGKQVAIIIQSAEDESLNLRVEKVNGNISKTVTIEFITIIFFKFLFAYLGVWVRRGREERESQASKIMTWAKITSRML